MVDADPLQLFFRPLPSEKKWIDLEAGNPAEEEGTDYWDRMACEDPGPKENVLIKEMGVKISEALGKIPEEFRTPIVLVDLGELSYAEAVEVLSCPLGTIRSRLSRGRKYLHCHLKGYLAQEVDGKRKKQG
jgi:DNA-directed RNA polymerase specialized sigma24 family protein